MRARSEGLPGYSLRGQEEVPRDALKRFVASCNSLTNDVTYLEGQWCERAILMQKLDSVLVYFTGLQDREDNKIGFHPF